MLVSAQIKPAPLAFGRTLI